MSGVSTPCIGVCAIDPASRLCEGCGRTRAEIAQWGRLSEAQRLAIMAVLAERLAHHDVMPGLDPGISETSAFSS